jgi:hypothetical protein
MQLWFLGDGAIACWLGKGEAAQLQTHIVFVSN